MRGVILQSGASPGDFDRRVEPRVRSGKRPLDQLPAARLVAAAQERAGDEVVGCVGGLAQAAGLIKQVKARVKGVKVLVGRWGMA